MPVPVADGDARLLPCAGVAAGAKPVKFAAVLALVLAMASPAAAHPHVWIETVTTFMVKDGAITGLRVGWAFDEFFSASLLEDFDTNHDRKFDAKEIAAIQKGAFAKTAGQNYFTFVKTGGVPMTGLVAREFSASVAGDSVHYSYVLPFPHPVDPRKAALTVTYYEDTYYIDVAAAPRDAVRFEGDGSLGCSGKVAEDPATTIYFGSVHPLTVFLKC
jgi:ABC-type uncharacterized transport system substrate-binding protein